MNGKTTPVQDAVLQAMGELDGDVPAVAKMLQDEVQQTGADKMTWPEMRDILYRGWPDPKTRFDIVKQLGPKNAMKAAQRMAEELGHPQGPGILPPLMGGLNG